MSLEDMEIEECTLNSEENEEDLEYIKMMEDHYNNGDIMTIESFFNSCKHNYFIDYDGYGELLNEDKSKSGIFISPSEYRNIPEGYKHIAWHNK